MVESKKCKPGCTCGRHKSSKCPPGCTCKRHTSFKQGALGKTCPEGCTCGRHKRPWKIDWNDPDVVRAYNAAYAKERRARDPEMNRETTRKWARENPYQSKYRMSRQDWHDMLERQNGCCYLCGDPFSMDRKRSIHVDHDHNCCRTERTCGKCIRGLACRNCNQGIGVFLDDPQRMRRAANALELTQIQLAARRAAEKAASE